MKKHILIVSHALELGGAERSLIGLLDALDPALCEVDLFLLRQEGELLHAVPAHIHLLPAVPAYTVLARPLKTTLKEGHLLLSAARLAGKAAAYLYSKKHRHTESAVSLEYSHKFTCPFMPQIQPDVTYDLAISFLTPHYFVAQKVHARKKIAWIHTDYSRIQVDIPSEAAMWDAYDHIISISEDVTGTFLSTFPTLEQKLLLIENILPVALIKQQAALPVPTGDMPPEGIRLLSIGRFCHAKNFDNVPDICARLRQAGLNVYWYLIGFGGDEALIREKIAQAQMEKRVILLGKKENPYPYIAACDLYVQPSRYEGKAVTVREAQTLGKPVVITRYATSASQLEEGVDGVIVPLDNAGCAAGIAALLRDPQQMAQLAENCRAREYSNAEETKKIYSLME